MKLDLQAQIDEKRQKKEMERQREKFEDIKYE
jgi:hypothetical protein